MCVYIIREIREKAAENENNRRGSLFALKRSCCFEDHFNFEPSHCPLDAQSLLM